MSEFASNSVNIEVAWWAESTPLDQRRLRNEVVAAIKRALDERSIEILYPYRMLMYKSPLSTEQLNAKDI